MDSTSPYGARLARLASAAEFVDRSLLRMLRKTFLPDADASDEIAVWWSDHVEHRGGNGLTFSIDALATLRHSLREDPLCTDAIAAVRRHHLGGPPLLLIQESLVALDIADSRADEFDAVLVPVVRALPEPGRHEEIFGWIRRVANRLPARARATPSWLQLSLALYGRYEIPLSIATSDSLGPPSAQTWSQWLPVRNRALEVRRVHDELVLMHTEAGPIVVPATEPTIVFENVGETWRSISVPLGGHAKLGRPDDRRILETLRGDRYAIRSAGTHRERTEPRVDTGLWVLVDGPPRHELRTEDAAAAETVGIQLAREGHSLITFGTPGVAYVVARAFMAELRAMGFSSGLYRLLHVVEDRSHADFQDGGRTIHARRSELVTVALARAASVLVVGNSDHALDATNRPVVNLSERGHERWDDIVRRSLPPTVDDRTDDRAALIEAARALDERELDAYNERLAKLTSPAASRAALVRDARPSHRLIGYAAERRRPITVVLLDALVRELATVRLFWETRPLHLALELAHGPRDVTAPQARALAAVLQLLLYALQDPRIDHRREAIDMIEAMPIVDDALREGSSRTRALELFALARQYEIERSERSPGPERTDRMDRLVLSVSHDYGRVEGAMPEAQVWFEDGDGGRIIALGLVEGTRDPAGLPLILQAIDDSRSAFEQYRGLAAGLAIIDRLDRRAQLQLRDVVARQRSLGRISRTDMPRWQASEQLLSRTMSKYGHGRVWLRVVEPAINRELGRSERDEQVLSAGDLVIDVVRDPTLHLSGMFQLQGTQSELGLESQMLLPTADQGDVPMLHCMVEAADAIAGAHRGLLKLRGWEALRLLENCYASQQGLIASIRLILSELEAPLERHERVWIASIEAKTPPNVFEFTSTLDLGREHLVAAFATVPLRPLGIYEVIGGTRNQESETSKVRTLTALCRLVIATPVTASFSAQEQHFRTVVESNAHDTHTSGVHGRLLGALDAMYRAPEYAELREQIFMLLGRVHNDKHP